jgi:hypothetical protein
MARRVFFSFHYEADVWRAGQVRNSWVTKVDREAAGFWDAAAWEEVKRGGDAAVKRWIDGQLAGTSVTVVLIGAQTASREYVNYEITQSHNRGSGLLGIYVDQCRDRFGNSCWRGVNPFADLYVQANGYRTYLSHMYPTYDWLADGGYHNLPFWIENAARAAGR